MKKDDVFKETKDGELILPKYIDKEMFQENREKLLKMKHFDFDFTKRYTQEQIENIMSISGFQLFLVCYFLSNTFKKAFYKSIQLQIKEWIGNPRFDYPLSGKQENTFEKTDLYQKFKGRNYNFRMLYDV